jgi:hypothetical protein
MNKDEALKMAIEAFELEESTWWSHTKMSKAYNACKEALEQQAQEPVAWMSAGRILTDNKEQADWWIEAGGIATPLYTHSTPDSTPDSAPAHQWQGLTDDEVDDFMFQSCDAENGYSITDLIRLVEQALKEKNHGL